MKLSPRADGGRSRWHRNKRECVECRALSCWAVYKPHQDSLPPSGSASPYAFALGDADCEQAGQTSGEGAHYLSVCHYVLSAYVTRTS